MTSLGLRVDISFATGFVIETGLYCTYACLFVVAFPAISRARRLKDSRSAKSAWVFLIFTVVMYLVATAHLILAGFCFYKTIFSELDLNGAILYLQTKKNHWEFRVLVIFLYIQIWLGDSLVIYRCYVVWDNNLWLIAIPVCLSLSFTGIYISIALWTYGLFSIVPTIGLRLVESIYPLVFAQNFITTGLIILKIFLQHRASKKAGIVDVGSNLRPIRIVRIVIESAGVYTVQSLILNILFFKGDNFQQAIQLTIVPTIGITFLLLAFRVETSRNRQSATTSDLGMHSSMLPQWLRELDSETGSQSPQERSLDATWRRH